MDRNPERRTDHTADRQRLRAEALADPTRFAVYQAIRRADRPLTVAELTEAVGVHHTAVRAHLAKLRDAGLITESHAEPTGPGRPKLIYNATAHPQSPDEVLEPGREPYRELSALLAEVVRERRTPREVGAAAGRRSARHRDPTGETDTVELIESEARDLGFDPRRRSSASRPELVLRHCPFAEVAAEDPETICSLHLGIAEGIAESRGDVEVVDMVVRDPNRAGCRLRLRRIDTT